VIAVPQRRLRRLVVPVALTVVALAVAASAISTGCGDDSPHPDASIDATPDTPIA
jgi:hypothetical protein